MRYERKRVTADFLYEYLEWGWTFVEFDEDGHALLEWRKAGAPP